MGFYDIHFTHGNAEFGKDFIAKRDEGGETLQYSFQSKAGDIKQRGWRDEIQGQMLESVISPRTHPNFDAELHHQTVLVLTGRLTGNAPQSVRDFADTLTAIGKRPMIKWDRQDLIAAFMNYGLDGVHRSTAQGLANYGQFYTLYGRAVSGLITEREIERHSHSWVEGLDDVDKRILIASIEAETIASKCVENDRHYEAFKAYLGLHRALLYALYAEADSSRAQKLTELHPGIFKSIHRLSDTYLNGVREMWTKRKYNLLSVIDGPGLIVTYPIHCAHILEISGLKYFLDEEKERKDTIGFLEKFVSKEPGAAHIVSDRYAVSLVAAVLALRHAGRIGAARQLLNDAAVWLCDRYEKGSGLAAFEATVEAEVATLLGYPFEFIDVRKHPSSFLATAICDLAAYVGDARLYEGIVNDINAAGIIPQYWQPCDSIGQFLLHGDDIIQYPTRINYSGEFMPFEEYQFAEHIKRETRSFRLAGKIGATSYLALSLFLRDRYFPTLWSSIGT